MAPPNPWDKPAAVPQRCPQDICGGPTRGTPFAPSAGDVAGNNGYNSAGGGSGSTAATPPPLPPRPATTSSNFMNAGGYYGLGGGSFGPLTNPYFGNSSSYGYGGYGYGGGYNRMPYASSPFYGGAPETGGDFVRAAEERSRNAFQSIETVVQAFSSVSMMLESTLTALYSSFRAVLGVAEQFSRLRLQLSHVFTTLAVVRFIRWLWRRILVFMRLRRRQETDDVWRQAASAGDTSSMAQGLLAECGEGSTRGHWSSVVFFAVVIGGPYLIWKLVSKLAATVEDQKRWATGEKDHFVAVALYDFQASSSGELSIRAGQRVRLAPKELQPHVRGWILGSIDGRVVGLLPANYVKVVGKQTVNSASTVRAQTMNEAIEKQIASAADDPSNNDAWNKFFEEPTDRSSS